MTDSVKDISEAAKTDEGHPAPESESAPPKQEEAIVSEPEPKVPVSEYDIIPSTRVEPETNFAADHYRPLTEALEAAQSAPGKRSKSKSEPAETSIEKVKKFASSPTRVYAAIGVGLGLLVGLLVAVIFLHPGTAAGGPTDMGTVNAYQYGLKGHLTTEWKNKLEYHLTVEPSAPEQRAGFLAAVNGSPRPLSIGVQMKDPFGTVLCGETVLVKYDPRNAPGAVLPVLGPRATRAEQARATRDQIARGINLARLEGQELDREHGKTIFQEDVGPDGQVASISAQGILPCTKKQFDTIASWGLTADFPMVAAPAQSQGAAGPDWNGDAQAGESQSKRAEERKQREGERARRRPAPPVQPIYIEGDDEIMLVDASNGVLETRNGKALLLDKTDTILNTLKGRDVPIPIHYRCDQAGNCTFAGVNTGVHHAHLRR